MQKPHETLEKVGLLRSLERKDREAFERRCQWRHAHPKEWLLEQNDIGTDIYFLTSGVVRVLITPSPDREIILGDIEAGGYFGEMAAIDGQPRSAGILAITDATIARMPAAVFREIIHKYPDVASNCSCSSSPASARSISASTNSARCTSRTGSTPSCLRRSRPDPTDKRRAIVSPPPVHSDIAARVSTRREMVARELKALERAGPVDQAPGGFRSQQCPRTDARCSRGLTPRSGRRWPPTRAPLPTSLFHRLVGDFDQPGGAAAGKQRNAEHDSAQACADRGQTDFELARALVVGAALMDMGMTFAEVGGADHGEEFGGILVVTEGMSNLLWCHEHAFTMSNVEVRKVTD